MSHTASRSSASGRSTVSERAGRASVTARLDRIPVWPYERKLLWIIGAGYFFAFFDIVTISFAAPVIATQFHVSKATVTLSCSGSAPPAARWRRPRRRIRPRVKALTGHAVGTTPASREQCLSLLEAVGEYPSWHSDVVRSVEVLERADGGQPTKVQAKLRVERGPLRHGFDLTMAVQIAPPESVKLSRIPHHGRDGERFEVIWRLSGDGPTQIHLDLAADLDVPRFLPLGDVGDAMAAGFVNAATRRLGS